MKKSIRIGHVLASAAVLGLALSGCTKTQEPPGTLHLATPAKIKGLDPAFADDLYGGNEVGKVYEGLLQYHYLKRPYELIPNLAEAMPKQSADGKTITFKLKKGVLFHDDPCFKATNGKGRELVAEDLIYSWKRVGDPKLASPGWWTFDGKIEGFNEWRAEAAKAGATDYSKPISGLKAIDNYTLQVKLTQRSELFLYSVAMTFSSAIPKEAVEHYGKEIINHAVGTGPFQLVEFNGSSKIIYVKNPTYRRETYPSEGEADDKSNGLLEDAGKLIPQASRVVVSVFTESQPMWLNFMAGQLDAASIPKDNFTQAITADKQLAPELKNKGVRLIVKPQMDITHESFNMSDPVVGHPAGEKGKYLRQAISMAINQEEFNHIFYNDQAVKAEGPIPPGIVGYDEKFRNPYRVFDIAKAKSLLAKAGYPGGKGLPPIEFVTIADSTHRQMSEWYTKQYAALGIVLKVNSYSWPEFQANVKNKKGMMWGYAWGADYPDAENFLQLFYSKNASPGPNDSNYSNPEFDKLYEKALMMSNSPARTAIYQQMVKLVVEDCPWIFGSHRLVFALTNKWMKSYKPHDLDHGRVKYYRVDPALKN